MWIKNTEGHSCFAQWEDVGPSGSDDAEYVFGSQLPKAVGKPALSMSPAVAQYLAFGDKQHEIVSWRFVDVQDVPPGQWLKYDEQAVLYSALHQGQKQGR